MNDDLKLIECFKEKHLLLFNVNVMDKINESYIQIIEILFDEVKKNSNTRVASEINNLKSEINKNQKKKDIIAFHKRNIKNSSILFDMNKNNIHKKICKFCGFVCFNTLSNFVHNKTHM
jgi:hypothetical protein